MIWGICRGQYRFLWSDRIRVCYFGERSKFNHSRLEKIFFPFTTPFLSKVVVSLFNVQLKCDSSKYKFTHMSSLNRVSFNLPNSFIILFTLKTYKSLSLICFTRFGGLNKAMLRIFIFGQNLPWPCLSTAKLVKNLLYIYKIMNF